MIIECERVEIHEAVRIFKSNQKSLTDKEAEINYLPLLQAVTIKHRESGNCFIIGLTNIHILTPKDNDILEKLKDAIPSHYTKPQARSKRQ